MKLPASLSTSLSSLRKYVENQQFKGYDPYDTLNTKIPITSFGKWPSAIAIQIQKRNPFNIRPIIGIKKEVNPKAFGLFLHAYSILHQVNPTQETEDQMSFFFNWLLKNNTKGYSGLCWGYNFDWASPVKVLKAHSPTIVVSGFIAKGIFEYYQATKDPKAIESLESIGKFAWNDLKRISDSSGICMSYSTVQTDCCYNASMLGAELYAMLYSVTKKEEYSNRALDMTKYVLAKQQPDGHWNYSIDPVTGQEREQIDFHQGYVLDSLHYVQKYLKITNQEITKAIEHGLKYYREKQFLDSGQSIWRVPKKWPLDIHNQTQGILTFSRLQRYISSEAQFAKVIAKWTIENMQDNKGFFYYRNHPWYKIKIPYMRWSQAWMFLALSELERNGNRS